MYQSVFRNDLFAGQTIIVTGGGSGIGRCTAHELASLGAHTVLIGRMGEKLQRVTAEITEDGGSASWKSCDIRNEERVAEVVAEIVAEHGRIHGLVNNAGGQFPAPLSSISKRGWDAVVGTNLTGGFLFAREVFEASMGEHGGAIVNMLADYSRGMPGMGHSGAARGGMANLTMTAAVEWAWAGVRVNAVAPGWIASSGLETYPEAIQAMFPKLRDSVPLKRLGTEAEVSAAIVFLLSPAAAFVTGEIVRVDGAAPLYSSTFPMPDESRSTAFNPFHRSDIPDFVKPLVRGEEE